MNYRRARVKGGCYAFTVVTDGRRPVFRDAAVVALLEAALAKVQDRHPFEIEALVVLPDHLHTVWTLPVDDDDFPMRWRLIKEAFTRAYLRTHAAPPVSASRRVKGEQSIWQRRFWEHLIRDDRDFHDHLDYIHSNPVHHGLVAAPRDWPHSSFATWVARGVYTPEWGADELPPMPDWAKDWDA
jgi:putative transposase